MNPILSPHRLIPLLGACVLAGLLMVLMGRQQQIRALESSLAAQSMPEENASPPVAPGTRTVPAALSDEEQRELLTLRRQVGEGRRQRPALESLEAKNRQLHAQVAGATQAPERSRADMAYLPSRNARFVGLATPRDALESFFAAVNQRDSNALFQVLDEVSGNGIRKTLGSEGVDKTFAGLRLLPGFRIRHTELQAEGTARVEVEFDPRAGTATQSLTFQRVQGEWRLSLGF